MNKSVRRAVLWLTVPVVALTVAIGVRVALTSSASSSGAIEQSTDSNTGVQSNSVQLVVDFGNESGREIISKRVENFTGTGWELLLAAGLDPEGTGDYPTGFVCRLDGWPSPDLQDCSDTPTPTEGTWGYFVTNSEIGKSWIIAGVGSNMHRPKCGEAEAWVWIPSGKSISDVRPGIEPETIDCSASN